MFTGLYPAVVTPFRNGEFDEKAYRKILQYLLDNGADGVVPNGTTGENPTLSVEERRAIISIAVEMCHAQGKKVIAGAGNNNTRQTISLVNDAEELGADGALVITPYYNKPTQSGLKLHFQAVMESTALPIIMYNVPSRTSVNMTAETAVDLSRLDRIFGIKEASGNLVQFAEISAKAEPGFIMLSGEDGLTLPMMAIGCDGVISVAGNVVPALMKGMLNYYCEGKGEKALEIHRKLLPLFNALFVETSPAPCKKALEMMGLCSAEVRLPLAPVTAGTEKLLHSTLKELELI